MSKCCETHPLQLDQDMSEEERQYNVNVPNIHTASSAGQTKLATPTLAPYDLKRQISRFTTTEQVQLTIGVVQVRPPLFIPPDMVGSEMDHPEELASSPKATQA